MEATEHLIQRSVGLALVCFAFPLAAHAQLQKTEEIITKSKNILGIIVVIVFSLALVVFAWGIVKYLTAAGDANKLKEARPFLFWGLLGLFVLAAIFGLVLFFAESLGLQSLGGGVFVPPGVAQPVPPFP